MSALRSDALVFFGATGDLACKKIFPSLQAMLKRGNLDVPVTGVAKAGWTLDQMTARAQDSLEKHGGLDPAAFSKLSGLLAQNIPWLLGGSADLGPSNQTALTFEGARHFQAATPGGKNLHDGMREFAMGAVVNGFSLSKLRGYGMPGLVTLRPGDAKGADVLADAPGGRPEVILIATGSELSLDVTARFAIEQASTFGWERYAGDADRIIGMATFGASAPLRELQKQFGFHPDRVVATAKELLGKA